MEDAQCLFAMLGFFFSFFFGKQTTLAVGYTCTTDATTPMCGLRLQQRGRGAAEAVLDGGDPLSQPLCVSAALRFHSAHRLTASAQS